MSKIVLQDENGTYTIEHSDRETDDVTIWGVVEDLIIPVLRAAGYQESTIQSLWSEPE